MLSHTNVSMLLQNINAIRVISKEKNTATTTITCQLLPTLQFISASESKAYTFLTNSLLSSVRTFSLEDLWSTHDSHKNWEVTQPFVRGSCRASPPVQELHSHRFQRAHPTQKQTVTLHAADHFYAVSWRLVEMSHTYSHCCTNMQQMNLDQRLWKVSACLKCLPLNREDFNILSQRHRQTTIKNLFFTFLAPFFVSS